MNSTISISSVENRWRGKQRHVTLSIPYIAVKKETGTVSSSIFHLLNIEIINSSSNQNSRGIPGEMVSSTSLRYLNLRNNNFTGPIPNCSVSLEVLDLSNNLLSGKIPSEIGVCSSLKTPNLALNYLVGKITISISNITDLQFLSLSGNVLIGQIPPEIGLCLNLKTLDLGANYLLGKIPSSISNISGLQFLTLASNNLIGQILSEIGPLKSLKWIYIGNNNFSGKIPEELAGSRDKIKELGVKQFLSYETVISLVRNHRRVDDLELLLSFKSSMNDPSGFLSNWNCFTPLCLWHGITCNNFSKVKVIDLTEKNISGTISSSIFHLSKIETTNLSNNDLSGEIPCDIVSFISLQYLNLSQTI
ncbi:Uncharacterized protein TCM_030710 [Theobroma cacao]|uniref:Leucine-rich repeat-containing N-terminal plant-type domain-containing protein n=1 Tax=Theobroma cacao TaxID=3641 RepID=A0A061F446_THECC|nr:Uncharacterized protein TCM_030710 [Theobroma cacao]